MTGVDLLKDLRTARARSVPWRVVVEAFRRVESSSAMDEQGRPWIKVAAEISGYSSNQIREMDRTLSTIESLTNADSAISIDNVLALPYSHLEIIARIVKADPNTASKLLTADGISRKRSFRDLREIYYGLRSSGSAQSSSRSAGHEAGKQFQQACLRALSQGENAREIFGGALGPETSRPAKWPDGFQYANPDFVVIEDNFGNETLHAFDCRRIFGDVNKDVAAKAIVRISLASTFFRTYFLIFPNWSDITPFYFHKRDLGLANVGILMLDGEQLHVAEKPDGPPSPDRQALPKSSSYLMRRLKASLR